MLELANELATVDGFVPKPLLGRPPAILATLLAGQEVGLGPIASLRAIYIIEGKATLSAEAARALVLGAGHWLYVEASDTAATAYGRRKGFSETVPVEWTIDRARRARLADRPVWRQYPRAMLTARATSELCHLLFPDVLAGLDVAEAAADAEPEPDPPKAVRSRKRATPLESPQRPLDGPLPRSGPVNPADVPEPPPMGEEEGFLATIGPASGLVGAEGDTGGPPSISFAEGPPVAQPNEVALRRLHARTTETFPNATRDGLDHIRHAIVAAITRNRPDGPIQSSAQLTDAELMGYDAVLNFVRSGECLFGERADGLYEFRMRGKCYTVHLDPPQVTVTDEPA
jgi:hypothetical protein